MIEFESLNDLVKICPDQEVEKKRIYCHAMPMVDA